MNQIGDRDIFNFKYATHLLNAQCDKRLYILRQTCKKSYMFV